MIIAMFQKINLNDVVVIHPVTNELERNKGKEKITGMPSEGLGDIGKMIPVNHTWEQIIDQNRHDQLQRLGI